VNDSAGTPWTLTMPAGGLLERVFTLTVPGTGAPYDISGLAWEYIARVSATDTTPGGLIDVTTTPGSQGLITVVSTAAMSQVVLTLYPAATSGLTPGIYAHALWSDPGTSSAYPWVSGGLIIAGNPQP
jgi:hypothetical protein